MVLPVLWETDLGLGISWALLAPGFSGHTAVRFGGSSGAEALSCVDTKASQTGVLASRRVSGTFLPLGLSRS